MGLPLYVAPVESDIRERPAPKEPGAHLRSAIRRTNRNGERRYANHIPHLRDRLEQMRHRSIAEAAALTSSPSAENTAPSASLLSTAPSTSLGTNIVSSVDIAGYRPRRAVDPLDDHELTLMSERWANLQTRVNPDPLGGAQRRSRIAARAATRGDSQSSGVARLTRTTSIPDSSHRVGARATRGRNSAHAFPRPAGQDAYELRMFERVRAAREASLARFGRQMSAAREAVPMPSSARLDGLGDRTRSLSPDGDNAWDTLLTTITPDPQPPSLGSSFASTSTSAASGSTSQSTTFGINSSAGTSMTGRDTAAEESALEQNCESGCENSDTEGDGEEDEDNTLTRFPPGFPLATAAASSGRRLSAVIAAREASRNSSSGGGSGEDLLDILGDMQRIVRHFARREDIPDEWWAEAGLSRTLSREASREAEAST